MFCIDASVLISATRGTESESEQSSTFLDSIREEEPTVFLPEIVIPEITSGIARATGKSDLALKFVSALRDIPNFVFVPIDNRIS